MLYHIIKISVRKLTYIANKKYYDCETKLMVNLSELIYSIDDIQIVDANGDDRTQEFKNRAHKYIEYMRLDISNEYIKKFSNRYSDKKWRNRSEQNKIEILNYLYHEENLSKRDIARILYFSSYNTVSKIFKRLDIQTKDDNRIKDERSRQRSLHKLYTRSNLPWNKGLNKSHPSIAKAINTSRSKLSERFLGNKNPMYGKVTRSSVVGYSTSLGHIVRSSWEFDICSILKGLNIEYLYEPKVFKFDNYTYTPDIYLSKYDCYLEIKGYMGIQSIKKINAFSNINRLIVISEKEYKWITKRYKHFLSPIDESLKGMNMDAIKQLYINDTLLTGKRISIRSFCQTHNYSIKRIRGVFDNESKFFNECGGNELIKKAELAYLTKKYIEYTEGYGNIARRKFFKFESRAASIIDKYYGKWSIFMEDIK